MLKQLARRSWRRLERAAANRGYGIEWYSKPLMQREHRFRPGIEFAVPHLLLCIEHPFFLSVGANDGKHNDPLYPFIKHCDLPGILLEPIQEVFESLSSLHAGNPRVRCINAAIAETDGEAIIYTVQMNDRVFSRAHQFSSFRKASLLSQTSWVPDIADRVVERKVRTLSFKTVQRMVAEAGATQIDILQTDTEGFDGEVLRLMWDSSTVLPSLVNFEHLHMKKPEIEGHIERFTSNGYLVSISDSDVLAFRPPYRFTYHRPELAPPGVW